MDNGSYCLSFSDRSRDGGVCSGIAAERYNGFGEEVGQEKDEEEVNEKEIDKEEVIKEEIEEEVD